jgi:hypothetical protein
MATAAHVRSAEVPAAFHTHDLHLAAYLLAKGAVLTSHVRDGPRVTFTFAKAPDPEPLVHEFWNGADVGVGAYVRALDTLKSIIHDQERR